jgi:chromosome segregation ATPase
VAALRAESVAEHTARCGAEAGLTEALQRIIQSLSGHSAISAPPNTDLLRHDVDVWARGVAQQSAESEQRLHALETVVEALGSQVSDADARRADYETKVRQSMDGISAQLQESSTGVKAEYSALNGRVQQFTDGLETSMDMILKIEEKLESMEETNERVDSNLELLQAYFDPGLGYEEAFFKFDAPFEERLLEIVSERFRLTPNQEREEDNRAEVMNRGAIMELIAEQLRGVRVNPQGAQGRKRRMDDDNEEEYDSASPSPAASTPRRSRTGDLQPQPPSIANPSQEMEPRLRRLEKEVARLLGQDGDDIYDRPPPPPDGTADYLPPATQLPP